MGLGASDQWYGREGGGLPSLGHLFFSDSESLARVTPLFLAATGFLSFFRAAITFFSILTRKEGMVSYGTTQKSTNAFFGQ